ncbi:hypothetical protein M0M57_11745 [Flavobacterium azooxidireducens]|uniref:Rod shape-determining protein MreD n=1 Tax=Flavobacterium azooxidireducens TaxID=1871076 RepID=A0ABY4KBY2_9FLAO|nr:hypothetical protein [Flavobacterium azooxidireducens]UPQ78291.1 hypothetical protein M0M57_11745 [Flavobacterium azooxidireducens]
MITNKEFISIIIVSTILFFVSDYFFNDAIMYIVGGLILAILDKIFSGEIGMPLSLMIWALILMLFIYLFIRIKTKALKYSILILIGILFCVVDLLVYSFFDVRDLATSNLNIALRVIIKSVFLNVISYFGWKKLNP